MNKPSSLICKMWRRRGHRWFRALSAGLILIAGDAARADSLWQETAARSMFADKRAHHIGDILTIIVQENQAATKQNNTQTSKSSGIDASISSFLYAPGASSLLTKGGKLPALKMEGKNEFNGGGQINNSERITARIAVRVIDVLPNGNMLIEGKRQTSVAGEQQDAVLRGMVRREDVAANNTVLSFNVADASIQFVSKGAISSSQKKGWFTRVWDKVTPF